MIFLCVGCASAAEYRAKYCNFDGAFNRGANDAEYHHKPDEAFVGYCADQDKAHAKNGYRSGYETTISSNLGRMTP